MKSRVSLSLILGAAALLFIISLGAAAGETQMGSAGLDKVEERKQLMSRQNECGRWGSRRLCGGANEDAIISDAALVVNEKAQLEELVNDDKQKRKCKFGCCSPSRVGCLQCCIPRQLSEVVLGADHEANQDATMDDNKQIESCRFGCCRFSRVVGIRCLMCCGSRKHSTMVREDTAVEKPGIRH